MPNGLKDVIFGLMDFEESLVMPLVSGTPLEDVARNVFEARRSFVENVLSMLPTPEAFGEFPALLPPLPLPFGAPSGGVIKRSEEKVIKRSEEEKEQEGATESGIADKRYTGVKGEIY